jgi:hypothetical protein
LPFAFLINQPIGKIVQEMTWQAMAIAPLKTGLGLRELKMVVHNDLPKAKRGQEVVERKQYITRITKEAKKGHQQLEQSDDENNESGAEDNAGNGGGGEGNGGTTKGNSNENEDKE